MLERKKREKRKETVLHAEVGKEEKKGQGRPMILKQRQQYKGKSL